MEYASRSVSESSDKIENQKICCRTHQTGEKQFQCDANQHMYATHSRKEVKIMSYERLNHEQSHYHLDQKNYIATEKFLHDFDISN